MKKMTWFAGLVLGLALTAGGTQTFAADTASGGVIHTGVYIDGIDVSGMTAAEARAELQSYVEELSEETLTLNIGENQLQPTLGELGLECTNLDVVDEAVQLGKTGNIIQRYKDRKEVSLNEAKRWKEYREEKEIQDASERLYEEQAGISGKSDAAKFDPVLNEAVHIAGDLCSAEAAAAETARRK